MPLRTRGHDFELPTIKYEFNKRNFIVRLVAFQLCVMPYGLECGPMPNVMIALPNLGGALC